MRFARAKKNARASRRRITEARRHVREGLRRTGSRVARIALHLYVRALPVLAPELTAAKRKPSKPRVLGAWA